MEYRIYFMPYCLLQQPDGKYMICNRRYKPLGYMGSDWVNYENYSVPLKGMTRNIAKKLSWDGSDSTEEIFLYNDGCIPTDSPAFMEAYLSKLSILARMKISSAA